ncbi:hypothetical protein [Pelomonas aquatica]|jgi:hypothetical protein|uniref:Uncharacterized protein n=1 Tax=Pelomonas aquatica TaxID=431058 RepID=A0A9X4LQ06_9BURK|nr:hypothetical protein [Pelomonas aquatica]MCY4754887.1 hypothetical protein [Pelomonas aquatica]MDG0865030.1 hypothetical protein [Pelomonas aquatica]
MSVFHPAHFYAELTDDRLRLLAEELLNVRYATIGLLDSPYDDNFTRESAVFGRCKNMLTAKALSRRYDWLTLAHAGMDVTINIGRVPVRYFRDDPNAPEKAGFFKRNATDCLFEDEAGAPVMWRFVVERALTGEDEDQVHFVGYNIFHEKVSLWTYRPSTPMLHSIDSDVPPTVNIPPAAVELLEDAEADEQQERKTGSSD